MEVKSYVLNKLYPQLQKKLKVKNKLELPRLEKAVINVGIGPFLKDKKAKAEIFEALTQIAGQKPIETKARKSISSFKIRKGDIVGYKVTLRGKRAYNFLYKIIHVVLPRVRDFRGIKESSIDKFGNLTIGFKEAFVFPELDREKIRTFFGLEVCFHFKTKKREYVVELLKSLGLPIII